MSDEPSREFKILLKWYNDLLDAYNSKSIELAQLYIQLSEAQTVAEEMRDRLSKEVKDNQHICFPWEKQIDE